MIVSFWKAPRSSAALPHARLGEKGVRACVIVRTIFRSGVNERVVGKEVGQALRRLFCIRPLQAPTRFFPTRLPHRGRFPEAPEASREPSSCDLGYVSTQQHTQLPVFTSHGERRALGARVSRTAPGLGSMWKYGGRLQIASERAASLIPKKQAQDTTTFIGCFFE